MPGRYIVLLWELNHLCRTAAPPATFSYAPMSNLGLLRMHLLTGFWVAVSIWAFPMDPWDNSLTLDHLSVSSMAWLLSVGCFLFQWLGCLFYPGAGMAASDQGRLGSNGSLPSRPLSVLNERQPGTVKWIWACALRITKSVGCEYSTHYSICSMLTTVAWKLGQAQVIPFKFQASFVSKWRKISRSLCQRHLRRSLCLLFRRRRGCEVRW